jgi:hypothetical protein
MAQIVLIAEGTVRKDLAFIGDIVSVHDDDVMLTGKGYENFTVVKVPGTAKEILERFQADAPEQKVAYKAMSAKDTFSFAKPEEATVWDDHGIWRKVENRPKYQLNLVNDVELSNQLADEVLTSESKTSLLAAKIVYNVASKEENLTELEIVE